MSNQSSEKKKRRMPFLLAVLASLFTGRRKGDALSVMEEELVQSPGRTIMKTFFKRKLTVVGLVMFTTILTACIVIPFFLPVDLTASDTSFIGQRPTRGMMTIPRAYRGNVAMLSPGAGFGVGLSNDGEIFFWGDKDRHLSDVPDFSDMGRLVHVSAGQSHIIVLDEHGYMRSWGIPFPVGINDIPPAVQGNIVTVEAGFQMSVAIDRDGVVHAWGNMAHLHANVNVARANNHPSPAVGMAGNTISFLINFEDGHAISLTPRPNIFAAIPDEIQGQIASVALSDRNGAAVLRDGSVAVWGAVGEAAMHVPDDLSSGAVAVKGGREHFTVLLEDGTVRSWGNNQWEQSAYPANLRNIVQVFADFHHNFALDADGNVHTWGLSGFLLGTDDLGRDIFRRLWQGGRYSLTAGSIAVVVSSIIGLTLGGLAGFYGKGVDMFIMRLGEVIQSIPFLPLAIILSWYFARDLDQIQRLVVIMVVLGVLNWPGLMRLTRGQILQARETEYVTAARALGVKERKIISRHIMPNVFTVILVSITLSLAGSMLTESTLSFIGFGVNEPIPTWGNMLTGTSNSVALRIQWWRWVFPAITLVSAVLSINLIGDGLREAIDPRSRGR